MKKHLALLLLICLAAPAASSQTQSSASPRKPALLLKNVLVYDGTGRRPFKADVRISGERISAVEHRIAPRPGERVFDGKGLALAPGFIDMHSHADGALLESLGAENAVRQGITTVLVGQDGDSMYPLANFFAHLAKNPPAINVASMVGQGTLREEVMGKDYLRAATPEELERMKGLVAEEMKSGAFGLSTGLEYERGHFSTTDEVVELSRMAARFGGFYISHVRDEGDHVFDSFQEVLTIGARAQLPVEITHIKLGTTSVWHQAATHMPELLADARRRHIELRADVYPYTFWQSTIRVIVLDRDFFNSDKVAKAIADNGGAGRIRITRYGPEPSMAGQTLEEFARIWDLTPVEAYMRIVRESDKTGADGTRLGESVIVTSISEDDLRWFIAQPSILFCTDGGLHDRHPRGAGAFPRILGRYVREEKVLPLELAIRKMTLLPARALGLNNRGRIAPGFQADLVLFDPARVRDTSTVENPQSPPEGIPGVMVGGAWVVDHGELTGARPGKVLRHKPRAFNPPGGNHHSRTRRVHTRSAGLASR